MFSDKIDYTLVARWMGTIIKTLIAVTMQHLKPMNEQKFVEETKLCHKIKQAISHMHDTTGT